MSAETCARQPRILKDKESIHFLAMAALLAGLVANALVFPAPAQAQASIPLANMPTADGSVWAIGPNGAGGVYIAGGFIQLTLDPVHGGGTVARNRIAHILADGTIDPAWNPNANNRVVALAVSGTTVYAGGCSSPLAGRCATASPPWMPRAAPPRGTPMRITGWLPLP